MHFCNFIPIFQCPASFKQVDDNIRNLEQFFTNIDRTGIIICWEPRGNWSNDIIQSICQRLDLVHCVDPFVNSPQAGSIQYFRLHGIGGYRYQFTPQDLEWLIKFFEAGQPVYCMFNNVTMLRDAQLFLKWITESRI